MGSQQRTIEISAYLIGLFVGIYFFTLNILGHGFGYFPGDLGDGRLNLYFLEHAHKFFTGQLDSFWDAPFMFPEKNVIAYSDNLLGSAPIYSFFRLIGLDNFTSYQWWFLMLSVLNYTAAYLFLKKLFKNPYSAIIGALVFTFSIALQSQMTHVQMFPRFPIPLAFLALIYFKDTLKPKYFFFAILIVVYQIYCGVYLGFMLIVPVGIFLIMLYFKKKAAINKKIKEKAWLFKMGLFSLINISILLPLMLPYMERSRAASINTYFNILHNVPTIKSFFFSQKGSLVWDFLGEVGSNLTNHWNHQLYTGGIATISALVFIFYIIKQSIHKNKSNTDKTLYLLFISGLFTWILFTRFENISAFITLYFLPGFTSIRALARIINIELMFFAIATSFVVSKVIKSTSWRMYPLFMMFVSLFILDNYFKEGRSYRTEITTALERTENLESIMSILPKGSIISYEPKQKDSPAFAYQIDAMLTSQKYDLKCINAYTGSSPSTYTNYWHNLIESSRQEWFSAVDFNPDSLYVITSEYNYHLVSK